MSDPLEPTDRALRSLTRIRRAAERGEFRPTSFERARELIGHFDNHVRWQALIAVGMWIRSHPEVAWQVVLHRGRSRDRDMRMGVATVLLEEFLGHAFKTYFPRIRAAIAAEPALADTLRNCWALGVEAKRQWWRVQRLLEQVEPARSKPAVRRRAKPKRRGR
jgi:hypothetical protein